MNGDTAAVAGGNANKLDVREYSAHIRGAASAKAEILRKTGGVERHPDVNHTIVLHS
jgi:hypothetical protein